jgi:hypothetical protein
VGLRGSVWRGAGNLAPTGIRSRTVQPVASRYTDCAIPTIITTIIIIINRPNIIIKNKTEKTYTLIDVAIPAGRNVMQKAEEKKLKYKSLCRGIQRMWNMKCKMIPV